MRRRAGALLGLLARSGGPGRASSSAGAPSTSSGWTASGQCSAPEALLLGGAAPAAPARAAPRAPARRFSSWEGAWASPRQHAHADVAIARSMLPHRAAFVPQFHAHGFMLVPESLLSPLAALQPLAAPAPAAAPAEERRRRRRLHAEDAREGAAGGLQQRRRRRRQQQQAAAVAGAVGAAAGGAAPGGGALYADSVKRKRRLKIKKHKLRKRRKEMAGKASK
jgi:hypothetical protein